MKFPVLRSLACFALVFGVTACTKASQTTSVNTALLASITTYDCTYFSLRYNDLASCQSATGALCSNESDTLPNGIVTTCYYPPTGYDACQVSPPTWDWIYTNTGWCDTGDQDSAANEIYQQNRSLIGCSSSICTCTADPVLTLHCAGNTVSLVQDSIAPTGTIGCANYTNNPAASPGPSATPIPACL